MHRRDRVVSGWLGQNKLITRLGSNYVVDLLLKVRLHQLTCAGLLHKSTAVNTPRLRILSFLELLRFLEVFFNNLIQICEAESGEITCNARISAACQNTRSSA